MTNEEQDLLIAYLVDAGEIFPDLDVAGETQFLDWYEIRQGVISGEAHYKAILDAARVRKRSLERGLEGCLPHRPTARASATTALRAAATPKGTLPDWLRATRNAGTTHWKTWRESAGSWTTSTSRRRNPLGLTYRSHNPGPRPGRSGSFIPIRHSSA